MKNLAHHKTKIIVSASLVALAVIIFTAVTFLGDDSEKRQSLDDAYQAYLDLDSQRATLVDELTSISEGCDVNIGDAPASALCRDFAEALAQASAYTPIEIDVENAPGGELDALESQVASQTTTVNTLIADLDETYSEVEGTLNIQRQVFVGEVEQKLDRAQLSLENADSALAQAQGMDIDGGIIDNVHTSKQSLENALEHFEDLDTDTINRYDDGQAADLVQEAQLALSRATTDLENLIAAGDDPTPQAPEPDATGAAQPAPSPESGSNNAYPNPGNVQTGTQNTAPARAQQSSPTTRQAPAQRTAPAPAPAQPAPKETTPKPAPAPAPSQPTQPQPSDSQWVVVEESDICMETDTNGNSWEVPCN